MLLELHRYQNFHRHRYWYPNIQRYRYSYPNIQRYRSSYPNSHRYRNQYQNSLRHRYWYPSIQQYGYYPYHKLPIPILLNFIFLNFITSIIFHEWYLRESITLKCNYLLLSIAAYSVNNHFVVSLNNTRFNYKWWVIARNIFALKIINSPRSELLLRIIWTLCKGDENNQIKSKVYKEMPFI